MFSFVSLFGLFFFWKLHQGRVSLSLGNPKDSLAEFPSLISNKHILVLKLVVKAGC